MQFDSIRISEATKNMQSSDSMPQCLSAASAQDASRLWCRLEGEICLIESGERAAVIALQGRRNHALGSDTKRCAEAGSRGSVWAISSHGLFLPQPSLFDACGEGCVEGDERRRGAVF